MMSPSNARCPFRLEDYVNLLLGEDSPEDCDSQEIPLNDFPYLPLVLSHDPGGSTPGLTLRSLQAADRSTLEAGLFETWWALTEDTEEEDLRYGAASLVRESFEDTSAPFLAASCLATYEGEFVGAAFIREGGRGGFLYSLSVLPRWLRRGVGRSLVGWAFRSLRAAGGLQLYSCLDFDEWERLAWHRRVGFEEIPSAGAAYLRAEYYREEFAEHLRLRDLPAERLVELAEQALYWQGLWERWRSQPAYEKGLETIWPVLPAQSGDLPASSVHPASQPEPASYRRIRR